MLTRFVLRLLAPASSMEYFPIGISRKDGVVWCRIRNSNKSAFIDCACNNNRNVVIGVNLVFGGVVVDNGFDQDS
jgi:hypothetical protein